MRGIGVAAEWHNEKGEGRDQAQHTRVGGAERAAHNNLGYECRRWQRRLATLNDATGGGQRQPQRGERAGRGRVATRQRGDAAACIMAACGAAAGGCGASLGLVRGLE